MNRPRVSFLLFALVAFTCAAPEAEAASSPSRPRVLVSTDIGGTDDYHYEIGSDSSSELLT
jgi:hypothetical protein